jgi:SlyX protein
MDTEKRLIELETKMAFQENLLAELNEVIIQQQRVLDRLRSHCGELEEQLDELKTQDAPAIRDDKPPHY